MLIQHYFVKMENNKLYHSRELVKDIFISLVLASFYIMTYLFIDYNYPEAVYIAGIIQLFIVLALWWKKPTAALLYSFFTGTTLVIIFCAIRIFLKYVWKNPLR